MPDVGARSPRHGQGSGAGTDLAVLTRAPERASAPRGCCCLLAQFKGELLGFIVLAGTSELLSAAVSGSSLCGAWAAAHTPCLTLFIDCLEV